MSIPVVARSKVWICGCSLAGNAGSIPTVGMGGCLLWMFFYRIEACPMDRSFAQGSPTDCSVYESDFET
jgi:hypothetical protein